MTPLDNVTFDASVTFKLSKSQATVDLLAHDMVDTLKLNHMTFCIIRGYYEDRVRCLIYKEDDLVYDQAYAFPQSHEVIGEDCMDLPAYRLAGLFYASYLAEQL
jgi:hypothetical protein